MCRVCTKLELEASENEGKFTRLEVGWDLDPLTLGPSTKQGSVETGPKISSKLD